MAATVAAGECAGGWYPVAVGGGLLDATPAMTHNFSSTQDSGGQPP